MSTVGGGSLIIAIAIQKSPLNHASMKMGAIAALYLYKMRLPSCIIGRRSPRPNR
jgi:hypothetical protein